MDGRFFMIVGPSGTGKREIINNVLARLPYLKKSVSITTRGPRKGEVDGIDYYFISKEGYLRNLEDGNILMHYEYKANNQYYGTLLDNILTSLNDGDNIIDETDIDSLRELVESQKLLRSNYSTIFIMPPSLKEAEKRIRKRGNISEAEVNKRLISLKETLIKFEKNKDLFDKVIVNSDLENAIVQLVHFIEDKSAK